MSWRSFGGTLVFGAVSALVVPALAALTGRWRASALATWIAIVAVTYVVGIAPSRWRGFAAALPAALAGLALVAIAPGVGDVALGAALLVGVLRGAVFYRAPGLRGLAIEVVLGLGGLAAARAALEVAGAVTPLSAGLALWAYFVVQSVFFLVTGVTARRPQPPRDRFEEARSQLLRLLGEEGT
jgi:hypothetical protein